MASKHHWIRATDDDPDIPESNRDAVNAQLISPDDKFFISYLPSRELANAKFNLTLEGTGSETALVRRYTGLLGMHEYFVLDGDHRAAYENLIDQGWDACFNYYKEQNERNTTKS